MFGVLRRSSYSHTPAEFYYDELEVDEFHTFIANKKNKVWLHMHMNGKAAKSLLSFGGSGTMPRRSNLKAELRRLGVSFCRIASDHWESFAKAFSDCEHIKGKAFTIGIEGNNCRLRHRAARAWCGVLVAFQSAEYHKKVFDLIFHYVNKGVTCDD